MSEPHSIPTEIGPLEESDNAVVRAAVLCYPAYRKGFYIKKDLDTRWPGKFDWAVSCREYHAGWFGSLESCYRWLGLRTEMELPDGTIRL